MAAAVGGAGAPFQMNMIEYNDSIAARPRAAAAADEQKDPAPDSAAAASASVHPQELYLRSDVHTEQIPGYGKSSDEQEDTMFSWHSTNGQVQAMAAMDGHSHSIGRAASQAVLPVLARFCKMHELEFHTWTHPQWSQQLTQLFQEAHEAIKQAFLQFNHPDYRIDEQCNIKRRDGMDWKTISGGTCCSFVITVKRSLGKCDIFHAQVGDSECIVTDVSDPTHTVELSVDLSPQSKKEWQRVQQIPALECPAKMLSIWALMEKTVYDYESPWVFTDEGDILPCDNSSTLVKNFRYQRAAYVVTPESVPDRLALSVTRALGDFAMQQYGLTWKPVITHMCVDREVLIQLATDGVWDAMTSLQDFGQQLTEIHIEKSKYLHQTVESFTQAIFDHIRISFVKSHDDASICIMNVKCMPALSEQEPSSVDLMQYRLYSCEKMLDIVGIFGALTHTTESSAVAVSLKSVQGICATLGVLAQKISSFSLISTGAPKPHVCSDEGETVKSQPCAQSIAGAIVVTQNMLVAETQARFFSHQEYWCKTWKSTLAELRPPIENSHEGIDKSLETCRVSLSRDMPSLYAAFKKYCPENNASFG